MDELIPLAFILMPVAIVWIVSHYRSKSRVNSGLSEEEHRQLKELSDTAEEMAERIKTLESILDAENPEWREHHGER